MASDLFGKLSACAKQFDKLHLELHDKLNNKSARQPASTLHRLNKETCALQEMMQPEVDALKKHNRHMEKTIAMMKDILKQKKELMERITERIADYTVQDADSVEPSDRAEVSKSAPRTPDKNVSQVPPSNRKQSQGPPSSKKESQAPPTCKTPLKSVENVTGAVTPAADGKPLPVTPSRTKEVVEVRTPKLTDFLSVDFMCERLEQDNLITKASKKSSTKKTPGTGTRQKYGSHAAPRSAIKSRKTLALSTPGKGAAMDDPATPVLPELVKVEKPDFSKIPKPDFTGKIAMIDVVEYHSQIDQYIKSIVPLELINKVVRSIDHLFRLAPDDPVEKKELYKLINPVTGSMTRLCITILMKLKRLKAVSGGKDMLMAVYGNPS